MAQFFVANWRNLLWSLGILAGTVVAALVGRRVVLWALRGVTKRRSTVIGQSLVKHAERPTRWMFPLVAVLAVLPGLPLPRELMSALEHITGLGLIAATAWLAILLAEITSDMLAGRYRIDVADNLAARRIQTQFQVLHRIVVFLVIVFTVAVMLMTFPSIKQIGVSVLASAGLASLVAGMAMKDTLANLIAGIQLAFTQPFRLEDAVVVEGEFGWIEEITTTYVVVRVWDLRRLVLPLSYFLEHPFQNWTRTSADLLGSTFIYADYSVPVDAVRAELRRICESTPLWKGKVCALHVTDADARTLQMRALMDARSGGDAFDLRCLVREKLVEFLQREYPASLPRVRGELDVQKAEKFLTAGQDELRRSA
jgi:small-conductance mechanosensitive channel